MRSEAVRVLREVTSLWTVGMEVAGYKSQRYAADGVFVSSAGRRWRGMSAELRCHFAGEVPPYVPAFTEIAVLIRGASVVTRQAGGMKQRIVGVPGTIGLCPVGLREEFTHVSKYIDEMLHIYLSPSPFAALAKHTPQDFSAATVRYDAGFRDPLIEHIATEVLGELEFETSCGDLLVETLADTLAVRLLTNYSSRSASPFRLHRSKGLNSRRLQRAIEYIKTNLTKEITVEELASVASLSRFHFSRMFKVTTGQSPSRFIGQLRLELAKSLLTEGRSITDVTHDCGFSWSRIS